MTLLLNNHILEDKDNQIRQLQSAQIELDLKNENLLAQDKQLQGEINSLHQQIKLLEAESQKPQESGEHQEAEHQGLLEQIKILKETFKANNEAEDQRRKELLEKDLRISQSESEVRTLKQQIDQLTSEHEQVKRLNKQLAERIEEASGNQVVVERLSTFGVGRSFPQIPSQRHSVRKSGVPSQIGQSGIFGEDFRMSTFNMRESQVARYANKISDSQSYSLRKDFLNLSGRKNLQDDMVKHQELELTVESYSDTIFLIDAKGKRKRVAILITPSKLFFFDSSSWKMIYKVALDRLSKISIASQSCGFLCFHMDNKDDLLLESFRRVEVIAYLSQVFKNKGYPMFKVVVSKTIELKKNGKKASPKQGSKESGSASPVKDMEPEKAKKAQEAPYLQDAIRNAKKSGFMRKLHKGIFNMTFCPEYFFILTDIGMIYFRKYGDLKTAGFLPVLGATVKPSPKSECGKDFAFSIKSSSGEKVLQCYSELEMQDWLKCIKQVQEVAIGSKDTMKEMKKII